MELLKLEEINNDILINIFKEEFKNIIGKPGKLKFKRNKDFIQLKFITNITKHTWKVVLDKDLQLLFTKTIKCGESKHEVFYKKEVYTPYNYMYYLKYFIKT